MRLFGQDKAVAAFVAARAAGALHHAWLLSGPRGVGKARFADMAALRILAEAAGPAVSAPGLGTPESHPIAHLKAAGSHPDFRRVEREPNEKGDLRRNITIAQVRKLGDLFTVSPAMSPWRVAVIDSVDDLEPNAANALLKMLEEPPANCLFLLVSHAPGRLLPTIRSRCRRLDFTTLPADAMMSALEQALPDVGADERAKLIPLSGGSVARALAFAELDLAPLQADAEAILRDGDPGNRRRSKLASALALKAAAPRYASFLELAPRLIASEARASEGRRRERLLAAYAQACETAALGPRHSLDPAATTFQMGNILASVARTSDGG